MIQFKLIAHLSKCCQTKQKSSLKIKTFHRSNQSPPCQLSRLSSSVNKVHLFLFQQQNYQSHTILPVIYTLDPGIRLLLPRCGLVCSLRTTGAHHPIATSPSAHSTRRTPPSQSLPQKRDVDARSSDPRCALRRSGTERSAAAAAWCAAELVVISWPRHLKMEIRAQSD